MCIRDRDNPGLIINRAIDDALVGRTEGTVQILERLEAVTLEDVVRVAEQVKLDTVYFLTGKGGVRT